MKIILLENVSKVGSIGDIIDVKRGFARNFLISKKKHFSPQKKILNKLKKLNKSFQKKIKRKKKMQKIFMIKFKTKN